MIRFSTLLAMLVLLSACGGEAPSGGTGSSGAAVGGATSYLLKTDLPDALNVFRAKKKAEGEEVVVLGRVREEVEGMGAFTIIDDSIDYCGRGVEVCSCPTPWDYCCDLEVIPDASLAVEIRRANGDVVEISKTDIRRLDLVAIKGTLQKTESGGLMLVAKAGWFRRERPELDADTDWPDE